MLARAETSKGAWEPGRPQRRAAQELVGLPGFVAVPEGCSPGGVVLAEEKAAGRPAPDSEWKPLTVVSREVGGEGWETGDWRPASAEAGGPSPRGRRQPEPQQTLEQRETVTAERPRGY